MTMTLDPLTAALIAVEENPDLLRGPQGIEGKAGVAGELLVATQIQTKAAVAIATNNTFLAIASPTTAQVTAQVKALTKENNALIRLLLGLLDSAADT